MHSIYHFFAGLAVAGSLLHADESQLIDENFLTRLRAESTKNHPSAKAGKHRANAATQDIKAVRLWDDPMFGFGFMGSSGMMRMDEGDLLPSLEVKLPKPGMYAARKSKAEAVRRAEIELANGTALSAGAEAARDAIELALADESITIQQARITWLAAMAQNAKQMAADPKGNTSDAIRMETELVKERLMLDAARRNREGYSTKLNLTLGRPLDSPWPSLKLPTTPPPVPIARAEIARIPHANPKVRSMLEMASAARAETRMADRDKAPEVSVGVDSAIYSRTGDIRSTTVGFKITLPWLNEPSYKAKIDAAKSRELAATSDVEAMRREIATMVLSAVTDASNAAAQAHAYSGEIQEKAQLTTKTIEASWISSKAPLTDLLDSSRTLFAIRLEQRRMVAMQLAALEQLHTLVPNR